jgi:hypothetical protein
MKFYLSVHWNKGLIGQGLPCHLSLQLWYQE